MDSKYSKYFHNTKLNEFKLTDGYYAEIWIEDMFFDYGISTLIGGFVETFAIFDIHIWDIADEEHEIGKEIEVVSLQMPTIVRTHPHRIDTEHHTGYSVLTYLPGDDIIVSTLLEQNSDIARRYVKLILAGKLPSSIGYDQISEFWTIINKMNGVNMGVNILFLDLVTMVVCRDPDNVNRQFREALRDNPKISMNSRNMVNLDKISALISHFSAFTGPDPKSGITSSIGAEKTGDLTPTTSDVEEAIE